MRTRYILKKKHHRYTKKKNYKKRITQKKYGGVTRRPNPKIPNSNNINYLILQKEILNDRIKQLSGPYLKINDLKNQSRMYEFKKDIKNIENKINLIKGINTNNNILSNTEKDNKEIKILKKILKKEQTENNFLKQQNIDIQKNLEIENKQRQEKIQKEIQQLEKQKEKERQQLEKQKEKEIENKKKIELLERNKEVFLEKINNTSTSNSIATDSINKKEYPTQYNPQPSYRKKTQTKVEVLSEK